MNTAKWRSTILAACVVGTIVVPWSSASAAGTASPSGIPRVISAYRIGGLALDSGTRYDRARRYFAHHEQHASVTIHGEFCYVAVKTLGIAMIFATPDGSQATPAKCTFNVGLAEVRGERWHTRRGLHVGASIRSLRGIYPHAENGGRTSRGHYAIPGGATQWSLTRWPASNHAAHPTLIAYARAGRVSAFGIVWSGH